MNAAELNLRSVPHDLLVTYCRQVESHVQDHFNGLHDNELSIDTFSFSTSVSAAVHSTAAIK